MAETKCAPRRSFPQTRRVASGVFLSAACALVLLSTRPARAADAADVDQLNKQALEAFDGLNFDQAKELLEKALAKGEALGLEHDPVFARTHLDLGMVLIAGFQKRDEAIEHFKAAVTIAPDVAAPAGLFNPEVQAAFDDAKQQVESEKETEKKLAQPRRPVRPTVPVKAAAKKTSEEGQGEEEEDGDDAARSGFFLSLGVGSGAGIAKGKLDTNTDLAQNGSGDNSWSGGLAASRLGHVVADVGYFVSKDLLLSIEGRLQLISGTTSVTMTAHCPTSCSPPSTAFAATAKATYFFASGSLRPFVSGGIGGGSVREVVKVNVTPNPTTHCGSSGTDPTCVDTVTGGPLLLAVGGGVAYRLGSVDLLASLTSNIGVPKFMINVDLTLGVGFRL